MSATLSTQELALTQKITINFPFGRHPEDFLQFFAEMNRQQLREAWSRFLNLGIVGEKRSFVFNDKQRRFPRNIEYNTMFEMEFVKILDKFPPVFLSTEVDMIPIAFWSTVEKKTWAKEIIVSLGGIEKAVSPIWLLADLLNDQKNGESGRLLITSPGTFYGSLFFVRNIDGVPRKIFCYWDKKWHIQAERLDDKKPEHLLSKGHLVFCGQL